MAGLAERQCLFVAGLCRGRPLVACQAVPTGGGRR